MLRRDARASVGHLDIAMGAAGTGPHPDIAARCPTAFPIRLASIRSTRRGSVVSVSGSPPAATRSAKPRAAISTVTRDQTSHQGRATAQTDKPISRADVVDQKSVK